MKKFYAWYQKHITGAIFTGLILGILTGLLLADRFTPILTVTGVIGGIYMNALNMMIFPMVFCSIVMGICSIGNAKTTGKITGYSMIFFLCTTAIASAVGIIIPRLIRLGKGVHFEMATSDIQATEMTSILDTIKNLIPSNPVKAFAEGNMLQVLVFAVVVGFTLIAVGEKGQPLLNVIDSLNEVCLKVISTVMYFTPIGVFCLMTNVVAVNGADIIGKLALIIGVAYIGYIVHVVVVYGLSVKFLAKMSPLAFFKGIAPAMITAFTTTSSNATLPVNIECCNKMGAEPEISSFVLPLGATINMDGTAIYQAVCAVFIACCYGVQLTLGDMAMIVLTATLASVGTAGVSGAGMIMLAMVLTQVGLPVEGIAIIAGVDKLFDMGRTALNITGDATCALFISRLEREKAARKAAKAAK